jgi:hypothetical protein
MTAARLAVLGLALAAAACAKDGTGLDAEATLNSDVALFAADAAGQDVEIMRGPGGRFGLGLPADPGSFECGTVERGGMTVTRTCAFYDADGAEQASYDALTTESVVLHVEMNGSVDRGDWGSSSVSRVRDFTVTGLAGAETSVTWNGTGSGTMSRIHQTRDGDDVQMEMTSSQTVTDVVIPVPRTLDGWPLGGTIALSVTVTITGGPRDGTTHQRDVTITFDGTQYATVTVGDETFTVDLANREHRRRRGPRGGGGRMGQ